MKKIPLEEQKQIKNDRLYKRSLAHRPHALDFSEVESMTKQEFLEGTLTQNVISKYINTGVMENVNKGVARYGDFTIINEFQEAQELIAQSNSDFMLLPPEIREQFNNNAGQFFEEIGNPENKEKFQNLGLIEKDILDFSEGNFFSPETNNIQKNEPEKVSPANSGSKSAKDGV